MSSTALLVIDAQASFVHRPYFQDAPVPAYLAAQNALIAGAVADGVPVIRIFHAEGPNTPDNPFAPASGAVAPFPGLLDFEAAATFTTQRHSALVGTGLDVWLVQHGVQRLVVSGIRTEQCCETTTRHASDLGWSVDYVTDATLTFDMEQPNGKPLRVDDIKARTATVLHGRFATVCSVAQARAAWQPTGGRA